MHVPAREGPTGGLPEISVVIPSYNEAHSAPLLLERLRRVLGDLQLSYEVIFVDDGSQDDTSSILRQANEADDRIKVVILSRNFGKEAALSAGLCYARGAAVIPMDGDLQHPPELIPDLVAEWRRGADVVVAVRRSRRTDPLWRTAGSRMFFVIFNRLSETPIVEGAGDFRLFDRRVVDVLNRLPERTRFLKGLYSWVGFRQALVPFDVEPRRDGHTSFRLLRLMRYSLDALTSFSTFPLRVWTLLGTLVIAAALIYAAYIAVDVIVHGRAVPGFASLVVLVVLIEGIQFLTLGIMGEYVGRIMMEVKGRPLFVVRETFGVDPVEPR